MPCLVDEMVGLGIGVFFVGYSVLAYGWSQLRGCNAGFFDLIWPGRFTGCNPDTGGGSGGGTTVPLGSGSSVKVTPQAGGSVTPSSGGITVPIGIGTGLNLKGFHL